MPEISLGKIIDLFLNETFSIIFIIFYPSMTDEIHQQEIFNLLNFFSHGSGAEC